MKAIEMLTPTVQAAFEGGRGWNIDKFDFITIFQTTTFDNIFSQIIGIVLTIAALVAFIYLLIAGFQYITAGGDTEKATKARTAIINALIGIVVIIVSYVILRYVGQSNNLLEGR
jgi:uncharacterized membrane protein